ncbi:phosphoenolpyruvate hydrolase family protein [Phytohabitans sp. ZYX-F-186]|uniref:Phosphoenolpyruvate hydrolase family protein n=1 Tax=Phytohabitans maris TaxID=3071409 RepID=A0ABU0ZKG1_9ACTN|nr:phosphoenolpyruvate hydrolase family protein [Phytohabitans sp. ZYX-F-186]MDQ7907542.1 phosphoenolpyruvate hydrolase family protein [Phytohabitans sp. ZYX-F-186]
MTDWRSELQARIDARARSGEAFILAGAGVGLVGKAAVSAGVDAVMTYNIARFRMDGHSSLLGYLPYGDANGITLDLAARIIPAAGGTPVIAGVGAADPYRDLGRLLDQLLRLGYAGVVNTPTSGTYDGAFRAELEKAGLGYDREVEMVRICRQRGIFSLVYVFDTDDARRMAEAGADAISPHLGTTGSFSDLEEALQDAVHRTEQMARAAREIAPNIHVIAHGGPLETPAAVARVLAETSAVGYIAGSSLERIPVNEAVRASTKQFRAIRLRAS